MAAASPWANLPEGLLDRITTRLPCLALRVAFAGACSRWLAAVRRAAARRRGPPPRELPWVLLPSSAAHSQDPCFFCLYCGVTHRAVLPADVRGARCCGSAFRGRIFLALQQSCGYAFYNLHNGTRSPLPEILRTPDPVADHPVFIHAVRAVSWEGRNYLAAIIFGPSASNTIAFWRCDGDHAAEAHYWAPPMPAELQERGSWARMQPRARIADVLPYRGHGLDGFHVLTDREELLVYVLGEGPDGALTASLVTYHFPNHEVTSPLRDDGLLCTLTRYLVNYIDELVMVVRVVSPPPDETTLALHMFKLVTAPTPADDHGNREASWDPMLVLPTGSLFLGLCNSWVYPSNGIEVDGIYFLDDTTSFHDAERSMQAPAARQYPCSDMGYLPITAYNNEFQRIFPPRPPSEYSRAMWVVM